MKECAWGEGIVVKPDGIHELDACIYEEMEVIPNCTVITRRCMNCGKEVIRWKRGSQDQNIVRCKDCVHCYIVGTCHFYKCTDYMGLNRLVNPDDYCSKGEKKNAAD